MFLTGSCSRKLIMNTGTVEYISASNGVLNVNVVGVGNNRKEAIIDAEKKIFNVILFRGLPDSEYKMALVGYNEAEIKAKYQDYFNTLFNKERYKTFLISSTPIGDFVKLNGGNQSITLGIQLNISALMKDMESNNIIRKFGY